MVLHLLKKPVLFIVIATLLFNFLFWQEGFGVNFVVFPLFLLGSLSFLLKSNPFQKGPMTLIAGSGLAATGVLWANTTLSMGIYCVSIISLTGFLREPRTQYSLFGLLHGLKPLFAGFLHWTRISQSSPKSLRRLRANFFLFLIPALIISLYVSFYSWGNFHFLQVLKDFSDTLGTFFRHLFKAYPFARILLLLLAALILTGFYLKSPWRSFISKAQAQSLTFTRDYLRKHRHTKNVKPDMAGLRKEYKKGVWLMAFLNFFILLNNALLVFGHFSDGADYSPNQVWPLLLSIMAGLVIPLYFFRGNLNFYPNNTLLKQITHLWLGQNGLLLLLLLGTNLQRVMLDGLTYANLLAFIVASIMAGSLWVTGLKIIKQATFFQYFIHHTQIIYGVLVLFSLVNWEGLMMRSGHPLPDSKPEKLTQIIAQSEEALPILAQKSDELETRIPPRLKAASDYATYQDFLADQIQEYKTKEEQESWLSWNYRDQAIMDKIHHVKNQSYE